MFQSQHRVVYSTNGVSVTARTIPQAARAGVITPTPDLVASSKVGLYVLPR